MLAARNLSQLPELSYPLQDGNAFLVIQPRLAIALKRVTVKELKNSSFWAPRIVFVLTHGNLGRSIVYTSSKLFVSSKCLAMCEAHCSENRAMSKIGSLSSLLVTVQWWSRDKWIEDARKVKKNSYCDVEDDVSSVQQSLLVMRLGKAPHCTEELKFDGWVGNT